MCESLGIGEGGLMHADASCELDPKGNQLEKLGKDLEMLGVASECPLGDLPLWLSFKG